MKTKANVVVTASGTIVSQGIIKSLKLANSKKDNPVEYRIIATDMSPQAAGLYRSDKGILVPSATSPSYVESIIKICKEESVQAVFVGSDEELLPLANAKKMIESETESKVITNPIEVITIARDKWKTYEFLKKNNFPCAESSLLENQDKFIEEFGFPLVVKPREGHGSLHFYVVNNHEEVKHAVSAIEKIGWNPLLQEYLIGEDTEYTTGITINKTGEEILSSISIRKIIKNGQTHKAFIDYFDHIRKPAEEVALKLKGTGALNIQSKFVEDESKIFEINPRFSATSPIRAAAGVNEADIVFRNIVLDEKIIVEKYKKLVCMRYSNEVYVPLSTYDKTKNVGNIECTDSDILDYF